jgi:hypothetical protein
MHLLHHLGRPLERPRAGEDVNPSSRIASLKVGDEGRPAEDESAIEPKGEPEAEKAHSSPVEGIESPASKEPAPQRPSPHRRVCCIQAERRGGVVGRTSSSRRLSSPSESSRRSMAVTAATAGGGGVGARSPRTQDEEGHEVEEQGLAPWRLRIR